MSGLSFPDLVIAGSSKNKVAAHLNDRKSVESAEALAVKDLTCSESILITNDAAVASKAAEEEKDKMVQNYLDPKRARWTPL